MLVLDDGSVEVVERRGALRAGGMTDAGDHVFWITSRAAGISALVLASLAVAAGLAIGVKDGPLRGRSAQLRTLHEALSLATLAALALHGARAARRRLAAGRASPTSPSRSQLDYRPFWTGLGIVAAYGLAALSLSYYARARIGVARWRMLHRFVALFWLLGVVHTLGAGTDAGQAVVPPARGGRRACRRSRCWALAGTRGSRLRRRTACGSRLHIRRRAD